MGWATLQAERKPVQRNLFEELSPDETVVLEALKDCEGKQLNQLTVETNLPVAQLSSTLFELEMKGIVRRLVGGTYRLV